MLRKKILVKEFDYFNVYNSIYYKQFDKINYLGITWIEKQSNKQN